LACGSTLAPAFGMAGWKDFREIAAWQHAEELKTRVYTFLDRPQVRRKFAYCDDMARAARSGPSNIAEGFGRFGNKEFANFARIAKASQVELLNHFIDARDQRLLTNDQFLIEEHYVRRALKTTVGLIRHLESSKEPPRPPKKPRDRGDENP
jgi:four helix bundle protein